MHARALSGPCGLFTNADAGDSRDRVKLMTVHTAKGLEFPHVFLCAMNEGLFPSKKIRTLPAMEEERRLAFVAMTRAEQGLYLSEALPDAILTEPTAIPRAFCSTSPPAFWSRAVSATICCWITPAATLP